MLVGYNPHHQKNVDTNDINNPIPFETTVFGYNSYSLFKRKGHGGSDNDGNPLIYALKGKEGYGFINPSHDKEAIMSQAAKVIEAMPKRYDTIIKTVSSNQLNIDFLS